MNIALIIFLGLLGFLGFIGCLIIVYAGWKVIKALRGKEPHG